MYHINEKDIEYRFGDSGPKYFMRGPHAGMGQALLKPGQDFANHIHELMDESFYVIQGKIEFVIDGKSYIGEKGDFYNVKAEETHYLRNVGKEDCVVVFCIAPFKDSDKVNVPL